MSTHIAPPLSVEGEEGQPPTPDIPEWAFDYWVARRLSALGFGAHTVANLLHRTRGVVQNWVAERNADLREPTSEEEGEIKRRLENLRRRVTLKHMDYFVATRLFGRDLSSSFISRHLGVPLTTIRTWRQGRIPLGVKEGFVDAELIERKMEVLWQDLLKELSQEDLAYHLALRMAAASQRDGRRIVGSKVIARVLARYLGMERLPEGTVGSWIDGERSPRTNQFVHDEFVTERYQDLLTYLTREHLSYHLSARLRTLGWRTRDIARQLGVPPSQVRSWITKGRVPPVARVFFDETLVERALQAHLRDRERSA